MVDDLIRAWATGTIVFAGILLLVLGTRRNSRDTSSYSFCGACALANGIFHVLIIVWMWLVGETLDYPSLGYRDLSMVAGPFTDPGLQVKNLLAIPIAIIWLAWAVWILNNEDAKKGTKKPRKRYLFPVIFFLLGWLNPDVYWSFFRKDQFEWPSLYVFCWVGIFWSETLCALFGILCMHAVVSEEN